MTVVLWTRVHCGSATGVPFGGTDSVALSLGDDRMTVKTSGEKTAIHSIQLVSDTEDGTELIDPVAGGHGRSVTRELVRYRYTAPAWGTADRA